VTDAGIDYRLPSKFSFTQLRAFESCPYQYRFAHILRVPVRGKAMFSFGKTMHATLQEFFRRMQERSTVQQGTLFSAPATDSKFVATKQELFEIYERLWQDDWFKDEKDQQAYKEKGRKALEELYREVSTNPPRPLFLELPFNYKIKDNTGVEYTIRGAIDRVDKVPGGVEIIDYKTGKGKDEDSFEAKDKEQLLIYQLAAQQVLTEPVVKLTFVYLETGNKVSFVGTDKELDKLRDKIIGIIEEIKQGKFPPTPGRVCQFCDFYNICEFREGK
jgi:DNA helicase-2/ATP-dependent DNA helicase PcrA